MPFDELHDTYYEVGDRVCLLWAHPTHELESMPLASRTKVEKKELPLGLGPGTIIESMHKDTSHGL
jgi:hypothetical protein